MKAAECAKKLQAETGKIFVGKEDKIALIIMAVLSGGHVLLDDLPGSGKTTLVKTLSAALGCGFKRVQFTPDLLPADIIGMTVFNQKTGDFELVKGPVHTHVLLADEINRAIPRTQAALLEAMEEGQVTVDGETLPLPQPFFVLATQNPIETETTFRLPAAQLDRFFIRLSLEYPDVDEEMEILASLGMGTDFTKVRAVTSPQELLEIREELKTVHASESIRRYIVSLIHATRTDERISVAASPRASRSLYQASITYAAMQGRGYVVPEDVQAVFSAVVSHRIQLTPNARYTKKSTRQVLTGILEQVPVESGKEDLFAWKQDKEKKQTK